MPDIRVVPLRKTRLTEAFVRLNQRDGRTREVREAEFVETVGTSALIELAAGGMTYFFNIPRLEVGNPCPR